MNKILLMGLLASVLGLGMDASSTKINGVLYEKPVAELIQHSLVIQHAPDGVTWDKIGSGTLIDTDGGYAVLTAFHVVEGMLGGIPYRVCSVVDVDESGCVVLKSFPLSDYTSMEPTADWAIISLDAVPEWSTPGKVRRTPIIVGEKITAVGSPKESTGLVTHGIVTGVENIEGVDLMRSDAFVFFGSSGGAVYDSRGRIIGITIAIDSGGSMFFNMPLPHMNYSVTIRSVAEFLDGTLKIK